MCAKVLFAMHGADNATEAIDARPAKQLLVVLIFVLRACLQAPPAINIVERLGVSACAVGKLETLPTAGRHCNHTPCLHACTKGQYQPVVHALLCVLLFLPLAGPPRDLQGSQLQSVSLA